MIRGLQIVYFCELLTGRQNLNSPTCETCRDFYLNVSQGGDDSCSGIRGGLHQKGEWYHRFSIVGRSWESGSSCIVLWTDLSVSLVLGIEFFLNNVERKEAVALWKDRVLHSVLQQGSGQAGWCFTWKWKSTFPHLCTVPIKSQPAVVSALSDALHLLPNVSPSQKQFTRGNGVGRTISLL